MIAYLNDKSYQIIDGETVFTVCQNEILSNSNIMRPSTIGILLVRVVFVV